MKEQLIEFETAKLAKEKGFNEQCIECYTDKEVLYQNNIEKILFTNSQLLTSFYSAPTQSLLQKWLREEHELFIYCVPRRNVYPDIKWTNNISVRENIFFTTYEEALEKGLQEALKLIKLNLEN